MQPKKKSKDKGGGGFPFVFVLVVLAAVGGLLGYNYILNVEAEKSEQQVRPYGAFKTEDLALMIEGYETELKELQQRETALREQHRGPQKRQMLRENITEFERMTKQSREQREVSLEIGKAEAVLKDLRAEKQLRDQSQAGAGWGLHARRLFSFGELFKKS